MTDTKGDIVDGFFAGHFPSQKVTRVSVEVRLGRDSIYRADFGIKANRRFAL